MLADLRGIWFTKRTKRGRDHRSNLKNPTGVLTQKTGSAEIRKMTPTMTSDFHPLRSYALGARVMRGFAR